MVTGRVVRILGNLYHVETPQGLVECTLTNKVRRSKTGANKPAAVGDDVDVEPGSAGTGVLLTTLSRRTKLCRAKGPTGAVEGVMVANAERMLAVFAARAPEIDFRLLDRALVMGEAGQMECAIAINKVDLASPPDMSGYAGYRTFTTCAVKGTGIAELRAWMSERTTVLMGPSGVGKSSILNSLEPSRELKTGELSRKIEEGRHTTTWVEMLPIPGGGWVVDTPGIESFGLWGVSPEDLAAFFPEFRGKTCRFRDCLHVSEPDCAVKADKAIAPTRYASYLDMLAEVKKSGT